MRDRVLGDLRLDVDLAKTILLYGDHRGHPGLRAIARGRGRLRGFSRCCSPRGRRGRLFIVATSLLSAGDHLVVLRPNYATNIETPRAIGCDISFVDLSFERGCQYTADELAAAMTPKTRLVSITTPHNPTGTVLDDAELAARRRAGDESRGATCWWTRPIVISPRARRGPSPRPWAIG